jgi:hypothetical protein
MNRKKYKGKIYKLTNKWVDLDLLDDIRLKQLEVKNERN